MGVKRLVGLIVALSLVVAALIYFRTAASRSETNVLRLSTWSNYFPDDILADFTRQTDIKVELSYFSSNEELFSKLKAGATGFDIILPSDYMVHQMSQLGMLKPLPQKELTNLSHLDEYYRRLPYDPGNQYSVPYTWGTTGIAVNTAKVKVPATGVTWNFLLNSPDPKRTSLLDDMREVFAAALLSRGQSPDATSTAALSQAKLDILHAKDHVLMFTSEPKPLLLKDELDIAHIYSSDAIQAHIENPNIQYFIPKEGGVIWTDNFALPASCEHVKEAATFINYFLDPNVALRVVHENHLATPNATARQMLSPEERDNPSQYPPKDVLEKMHFLSPQPQTLSTLNRMWTELKS